RRCRRRRAALPVCDVARRGAGTGPNSSHSGWLCEAPDFFRLFAFLYRKKKGKRVTSLFTRTGCAMFGCAVRRPAVAAVLEKAPRTRAGTRPAHLGAAA